jgi:hypothetical protein
LVVADVAQHAGTKDQVGRTAARYAAKSPASAHTLRATKTPEELLVINPDPSEEATIEAIRRLAGPLSAEVLASEEVLQAGDGQAPRSEPIIRAGY